MQCNYFFLTDLLDLPYRLNILFFVLYEAAIRQDFVIHG